MKDETRFTLRIDSELLNKIKTQAEKNKRSASKEIEYILEEYFDKSTQDQVKNK